VLDDTRLTRGLRSLCVVRDASVHLYESLCNAFNSDHEHLARFSLDIDRGSSAVDCEHVGFNLSYMLSSLARDISTAPMGPNQSRNSQDQDSFETSTPSLGNRNHIGGVWLHVESIELPNAVPSTSTASNDPRDLSASPQSAAAA
jgi:hypothetical protein